MLEIEMFIIEMYEIYIMHIYNIYVTCNLYVISMYTL